MTAQRFRVVGVEGAPGLIWRSSGERCSIGSDPSNDIHLDDETVSPLHCEIRIEAEGATVRDAGSRYGTIVEGVRIREVFLEDGSLMQLGAVRLRFELEREASSLETQEFGLLIGRSDVMRSTFGLLARAAQSDVTVLLEGETGTGKGAAAESMHRASRRRDAPFVVVDCTALPEKLLESELFGHERGAFTGAADRRIGALEEADGGTIFLDEIGELPLAVQPKLLRVLEERTFRRVGANVHRRIDVRVIAASNRDLRREVVDKRFRADLYFRLTVARITLPPLRDRAEDIPLIVERLVELLGAPREAAAPLLTPRSLARLAQSAWPGNVRELRNHVEQFLVFGHLIEKLRPDAGRRRNRPYLEARKDAIAAFEKSYLSALMDEYKGRTVLAANAIGVDRVYLYRLLRKHGLK